MSQKEKEVKQSAAEVENENLETEHTEADNGETSAGTENQEAETRENEVKEAMEAAGLTVVEINHQGEWVNITAQKQ